MTSDFELTSLWTSTLGREDPTLRESRGYLRTAYLDLRERVSKIVAGVAADIPGLTVHDVSHLDALWETASLIAGPDYPLNPAEAFVLGASFLLHDAALTLRAFPGGLADLRGHPAWHDFQALARKNAQTPDDATTVAYVLRRVHAEKAATLATAHWPGTEGPEFLIQDSELRSFYGPLIGRLAESHWWNVGQLMDLGPEIGASRRVPQAWGVEPVKLGALLRVADAAHIDARRAPRFLRYILKPTGVSEAHWRFQEHLAKLKVDRDALVVTSGPPFSVDLSEAWWLAYDAARLINRELSDVDSVLVERGVPRFAARRVKSCMTPVDFARVVRPDGWAPVHAELVVTDVNRVVEMLGGSHLYGDEPIVALRELIQNALDAVRVRRIVEEREDDWGEVRVSLDPEEGKGWRLSVSDTGIGMSKTVLTTVLLDFGRSLWNSEMLLAEYPGLASACPPVTGRFGIGFFSCFILGQDVSVTSRRYDSFDSLTLMFSNGLSARPMVRPASEGELKRDDSTCVSVLLAQETLASLLLNLAKEEPPESEVLLSALTRKVAMIAPCSDVSILCSVGPQKRCAVSAGDWERISGQELLSRVAMDRRGGGEKQANALAPMVDALVDDGQLVGRACIIPSYTSTFDSLGVLVVGGMASQYIHGLAGVLLAETSDVSRARADPVVSASELRRWATEQGRRLESRDLPGYSAARCSAWILRFRGEVSQLPICLVGDEGTSKHALRDHLRGKNETLLVQSSSLAFDEEEDDVSPKSFESSFELREDVIVLPDMSYWIRTLSDDKWPDSLFDDDMVSFLDLVGQVVRDVWPDYVLEEVEAEVGVVGYEPIYRSAIHLRRSAEEEEC